MLQKCHTCSGISWERVLQEYQHVVPPPDASSFLLFGAPVLQSATPYYKVLLQYYCVLLCTRKNYSSTTLSLYYKGLLQYYSVLQSTIPVLCTTSTTPVLLCTTKYVRVPVTTPRVPVHCTYFTHAQTCDNVRVQSATQWTASVHTLHMSKSEITFVLKVLLSGLLRYILYTPVITFVFKVLRYIHMSKSVITDNVRVGRMMEWGYDTLGGSSKNAIPLLIGAASLLLATQHTYFKKSFFFIHRHSCTLRFYCFSHGGQYVGVVTLPRATKYYSSATLCFNKTMQSSATLSCKTQ